MGKRNIQAKEINCFGCASFDFRFFTLDEEKVKSLHFFSAFLSQRFVAFYIQRIALGIIRCCTFIVHSNHNFLPHQNIPHSSPFSAGTRARPRSPRTTERLSTALRVHITLLACYLPISLVSGLITTGLQTPTIFFLWAQTALIRLFTHSGLYTEFEDERYKTSSEGLFQKICFLSN